VRGSRAKVGETAPPGEKVLEPLGASVPVLANYIEEPDLCRELRVTRRSFARWVASGDAPPRLTIARRFYYRRDLVLKWLADREEQAAPPPAPRRRRRR
jgi:hypothetical protein